MTSSLSPFLFSSWWQELHSGWVWPERQGFFSSCNFQSRAKVSPPREGGYQPFSSPPPPPSFVMQKEKFQAGGCGWETGGSPTFTQLLWWGEGASRGSTGGMTDWKHRCCHYTCLAYSLDRGPTPGERSWEDQRLQSLPAVLIIKQRCHSESSSTVLAPRSGAVTQRFCFGWRGRMAKRALTISLKELIYL